MTIYTEPIEHIASKLNSNIKFGLDEKQIKTNRNKYGENLLTKKEKKSFISKVISAVSEPMLVILLFSLVITVGINIGKELKSESGDFTECIGIFLAIVLSVSITLIMEGSSERAFNALNSIYQNTLVKVIREGKKEYISHKELVVGDIVVLNTGDKIYADGRIIESNSLAVEEACLTGESQAVEKHSSVIINEKVSLADRKNMLYSGTFVVQGECKMIITAVGDETEIGRIARELKKEKEIESPLQQKLNKLSKTITLLGSAIAILIMLINFIKLLAKNQFTFSGVQSLFINCIVLIVAAVPEGLPTIVAVSLALNMTKLAKENALIKKMIATETAGAVSVICSDKTGTLTTGKMEVEKVCFGGVSYSPNKLKNEFIIDNFILNSTAEKVANGSMFEYKGNSTECSILRCVDKITTIDYNAYRKKYKILNRIPFDNKIKMMSTTVLQDDRQVEYIKGAPEVILELCGLTSLQAQSELNAIAQEQKKARRVMCFAHKVDEITFYDGYISLIDPIRSEVFKAVKICKKAGIKIKILTGDNYVTAFSIAKELGICQSESEVINAIELDKLDDRLFKKSIDKISVIARSTPIIKMRVVKALKELNEVVAVTGDGINDAPAIKHADIGIAMGKTGSEITKETAEVVLLDDSFYTIVKAISFGRNVYRNLQRFILFQLSVNLTALLFITTTAILGFETPFNTLQLLWINVIMDGPPALTLGLENSTNVLMTNKPIKRNASIVTINMLLRILFNGLFMAGILITQYLTNFMGVKANERMATIFSLFILFQLFNAFNSRELGSDSIFTLDRNNIMFVAFGITFLVQLFIVQVAYRMFNILPLSFLTWVKIIALSFSIVVITEIAKLIIRITKEKQNR